MNPAISLEGVAAPSAPEALPEPLAWVTVGKFERALEARLAAGLLESEGIPVLLDGIHQVENDWLIAQALGWIPLRVPAPQADLARALLDAAPLQEESQADRCAACGHDVFVTEAGTVRLSLLAVHLFNLPLPWLDARQRCGRCGAPKS